MLQNIRVVLVCTSHPGNIGATARAMKNMGLNDLVLVAPRVFPSEDATMRASGADDVLAAARVVASLDEALADCALVMGTSARDRHIPWPLLDPRECGERAVAQAAQGARVALVFGREHAGLTNEELQRCRFHVHIPSDPEFSSLNLGAAVQVLSYEVRMAWLAGRSALPRLDRPEGVYGEVNAEELESFYAHLEETMVEIGFLDPGRPRQLMSRLRRLYGRAGIERQEMNILRGILSETQAAVRGLPHKRRDR